jgi:hypothetical protein
MITVGPKQTDLGEMLGMGIGSGLANLVNQKIEQKTNQKDLSGFSPIFEKLGYDPKMLEGLSKSGAGASEINDLLKILMTSGTNAQEGENLGESIQTLRENVKSTGIPLFSGFRALLAKLPGTQAFKERELFDTTAVWLTDAAFQKINKGTLSKDRQKLLLEKLAPNSKLTQAENNARIDALEKMTISGKPLTNADADKILDKIGTVSSQNVIKAKNPKTGEIIESSDGGATWRKTQ